MTGVRLGQRVGFEVGLFEKVTLRLDLNSENEQPCEELGLLTSHSLVNFSLHLQIPAYPQSAVGYWFLETL